MRDGDQISRRWRLLALILAGLTALIVYWICAYRTITWWDSAEYTTAAATLGIPHPPGSLLAVLLGWIVIKIPLGGSAAFKLNLFAGFLGALTVIITAFLASALWRGDFQQTRNATQSQPTIICLLLSSLILAFSQTLWLYSEMYAPYILTALFTVLILATLLRWWKQADSQKSYFWLFVIALLFGLDFSVHRTNLLLLPGLFFWILLRKPKMLCRIKTWLMIISGLICGLAIHLAMIPISARMPYLNSNIPNSLMRLWDYVTLKQYGGGWLLDLFPRNAPFWSYQVHDYIADFAANFCSATGGLGVLGILPMIIGLIGLAVLWKWHRRMATGLMIFFVCASVGAIIYFNVPKDFFRTMERHYLPSFLIFGLWICYGVIALFDWAGRAIMNRKIGFNIITTMLIIVFGLTVTHGLIRNFRACYGANRYFAEDLGANILKTVSPNAIIITNSENETHSLWYLQGVLGQRQDVAIINLSLLNAPWYLQSILTRDSLFPISFTRDQIWQLAPKTWHDTVIAMPSWGPEESYLAQIKLDLNDTVRFQISPNLGDGTILSQQDLIVLDMIKTNLWKRPIYISAAGATEALGWLKPYLTLEGLMAELDPLFYIRVSVKLMEANVLERYTYRGFADKSISLEDPAKWIGWNYYICFMALAKAEAQSGNLLECESIKHTMLESLPLDRLNPPRHIRDSIATLCPVE